MVDIISQYINGGYLNKDNISFSAIRSIAGIDCGLWEELDRGRAILPSYDHLNQYLYSHALMVSNQWNHFLQSIELPTGDIRLLDYGCGQALAQVKLFDNFGDELISRVKEIVLIEPSPFALARAEKIVRCYCPEANVICVNKEFDELIHEELNITDTMTNLHIFSNVLDVESFDYAHLYNTIFKKQEHASHVILAVSHDRNFSGGTARIENIYEYATQRYVKTHNMKQSAYKFFSTYDSRGREVSHVSWWLDIEQLPVTNS